MMKREQKVKKIWLQQILLQDGSVFSIQWIEMPERYRHEVAAPLLLQRYYRLIRDFTWSIIRPVTTDAGVEFRLFSSSFALLAFSLPQYEKLPEGDAVHLYISGGFLVQSGQCDRGKFSMMTQEVAGAWRVTVELSDYCPLLLRNTSPSTFRKALYRLTQAYIHKVVTVKYLISLYREVTGEKVRAEVETVNLQEGERI